jgi:hypothetical protein
MSESMVIALRTGVSIAGRGPSRRYALVDFLLARLGDTKYLLCAEISAIYSFESGHLRV